MNTNRHKKETINFISFFTNYFKRLGGMASLLRLCNIYAKFKHK